MTTLIRAVLAVAILALAAPASAQLEVYAQYRGKPEEGVRIRILTRPRPECFTLDRQDTRPGGAPASFDDEALLLKCRTVAKQEELPEDCSTLLIRARKGKLVGGHMITYDRERRRFTPNPVKIDLTLMADMDLDDGFSGPVVQSRPCREAPYYIKKTTYTIQQYVCEILIDNCGNLHRVFRPVQSIIETRVRVPPEDVPSEIRRQYLACGETEGVPTLVPGPVSHNPEGEPRATARPIIIDSYSPPALLKRE